MSKRAHRLQRTDQIPLDDGRPIVVRALEGLDDRRRNPKQIEPDRAAMRNGVEHGGMVERRAEALITRGSGGRKRSGPAGRHRSGRDLSKRR
jgi:hypothetical protein